MLICCYLKQLVDFHQILTFEDIIHCCYFRLAVDFLGVRFILRFLKFSKYVSYLEECSKKTLIFHIMYANY